MSLKSFVRYVLYPDCSCWLCRRDAVLGRDHICAGCREKLRSCIRPAAPQPLDGLSAGLIYEEPVRAAVHAFKYSNQRYLALFFAQYMSVPEDWTIDCMTPVPLHPFKHWLRSFNQSELLCKALSSELELPMRTDLLRRTRFTATQTHLSAKERQKNVKNAFQANPAVKGLSILLVDDVTTTHATLTACAEALKKAGAKRVYAVCACLAHS